MEKQRITSFEDLECWKACRELRLYIMKEIVPTLPQEERYRLTDQIQRVRRVGYSAVYQDDRNPARGSPTDQIGPKFAFDENNPLGTNRIEYALDYDGEIDRKVDYDIGWSDFLLREREPGGGGYAQHKTKMGVFGAKLLNS